MSARRPLHRPKRAAEEFAHASFLSEPSSKKARFDVRNPSTLAAAADDEEDAILELDEIGKKGNQLKRNAVELDGYESDSSNENFDARAEAKAQALKGLSGKGEDKAGSKDEDDADMFADLEEDFVDGDQDEDLGREGKKRKKEVKFLDADQIEGQVHKSKSGGHVSSDLKGTRGHDVESSSDESEGGDEERDRIAKGMDEELGAGSKKKHAPKLDAFNMRNEEEEGRFDANGNFIRNANDPFAVHDQWLDGAASKADMKKAREAEEKRDEQRRQRAKADDAVSEGALLGNLITRMDKAETVLEALARLGTAKEKKKPKWQKNKRKQNDVKMDIDTNDTPEDQAEIRRRETVEAITAAADQLLTRGQSDIYEAEREKLMRQYRKATGEEWVHKARDDDESSAKQWEYRWSDARDGGEAHGPYDGPTMTAWNEAGYFGEGVEFKATGMGGWSSSTDFV